MAKYEITSPGGERFEVTAPEGATEQQVLQYVQSQASTNSQPTLGERAGRIAGLAGRAAITGATGIPTLMAEGLAVPLRAATGGKYFPSPSATLQNTMTQMGFPVPANATERVATNVGSALTGAGMTQAALGLLKPVSQTGENIRQIMMTQPARQGVAAGTGATSATVAGEMGAGPIGQTAAGMAGSMVPFIPGMFRGTPLPETQQRQEILGKGRDVGYVFPPSQVRPSVTNKLLGGYSGQAATEQAASLKNQPVTNVLARRALGLPDDARLSEGTLETVRTQAAAPYREIAAISPSAKQYLEDLKQARFDANANYKFYQRNGDPEVLAKAQTFQSRADRIESLFERFATSLKRPELVDELRAGRMRIAKTYEVERALNAQTGDVDARIIGNALDKGAPMTNELKTIGQVQQAAPKAMMDFSARTPPGVSPLDYAAGGMMGAASGNYGLLGTVLGRPLARGMILSRPYQSLMASPQMDPLNPANAASLGLLAGVYSPR